MNLSHLARATASTALLLTTIPSPAAETGAASDQLIAKGDVYYNQLDARNALKYYLPAEKEEPDNVQLLTKISREYRHLMSDATTASEKLRLGTLAVAYAKRAAELGPRDADAQLAVAISYGKLQPLESNAEKLQTSRIIKAEVDKALKLNPDSDLAWHILGRWNMGFAEVTGVRRAMAEMMYGKLPVTTYQDAARCYEKAIELKPDRLMHYIELGKVYAEMGKTSEARQMISKGLAMKDTEKDDPATKRSGEEELAKLRGG